MEKYRRMPCDAYDASMMRGPFDSVGFVSATGWPVLARHFRLA